MKRILFPFLILAIGLCCFSYVRAQNMEVALEALAIERTSDSDIRDVDGLTGLRYISGITVEELTDDARSAGMTRELIASVVELRLPAAGRKVTGSSVPDEYVYARASVMRLKTDSGTPFGNYAVATHLSVNQRDMV